MIRLLLFADSFSYIAHSYTFSVGCFTTCCIYRHNPQKIVFKEPWRHYGKEVSFLASPKLNTVYIYGSVLLKNRLL